MNGSVGGGAEVGSVLFEEFMTAIGDKIVLQGWTGYRGNLDVQRTPSSPFVFSITLLSLLLLLLSLLTLLLLLPAFGGLLLLRLLLLPAAALLQWIRKVCVI
jgi:hypothetical protein